MGVGDTPGYTYAMFQALTVATIALVVVGLLFGTAGLAVLSGRLAARSRRPALPLAGERLQADPWAGARAHAAVLLTALIGVGFLGLRRMELDSVERYDGTGFHCRCCGAPSTPPSCAALRVTAQLRAPDRPLQGGGRPGALVFVHLSLSVLLCCRVSLGSATRRPGYQAGMNGRTLC
jgi:hypothetical protein